MNKTFWIRVVAFFVASMASDFVLHGLLLQADYAQLPNIMRTETDSQKYFHWMLLAHAFIAIAFVWIYERGREEKPWLAQGLRFGLAIAFVSAIPTYMIYYVVQPLPELLVVKQVAFELVRASGLGVFVAWMYR